jgi:hypothetical protein
MWIGINQLWTILSIDGLTGESGFAKDGAHTSTPPPPIFPAKNLIIKGLDHGYGALAMPNFSIANSRGRSIAFGRTLCSVKSDG